MKKVLMIGGCIMLGLTIATTAYAANSILSENGKKSQEIRLEKLKQEEKKLSEKGVETYSDKAKMGETIKEIASLEEKVNPEEYYRDEIESMISTVEAAVKDMQILRKTGDVPKDKSEEINGRIAEFGELVAELKEVLSSGNYSSYEELYKQYREKHSKIVKKYN